MLPVTQQIRDNGGAFNVRQTKVCTVAGNAT